MTSLSIGTRTACEHQELKREFKGDLDCITLKAMEKDRRAVPPECS
jgi:hypothetical protein